jgi:hypothetical protein
MRWPFMSRANPLCGRYGRFAATPRCQPGSGYRRCNAWPNDSDLSEYRRTSPVPKGHSRLADRLSGEVRDSGIDEDIDAGGLHADHLRSDRGLRCLIGCCDDDHRLRLVAKAIFETVEIIFPEVVVLVQHADFAVRLVLGDIGGIDASFALIIGLPAGRPMGSVWGRPIRWRQWKRTAAAPCSGSCSARLPNWSASRAGWRSTARHPDRPACAPARRFFGGL